MVFLGITTDDKSSMHEDLLQTFVASQEQGLRARTLSMDSTSKGFIHECCIIENPQEIHLDFLKETQVILAKQEFLLDKPRFQKYLYNLLLDKFFLFQVQDQLEE